MDDSETVNSVFPPSLQDLTPEWLTWVLRRNLAISESRVVAVEVRRIGAEVGFLDSVGRVVITYDRPENEAPRSLVIKVSSSDPLYQRIGDFYDAYEREFHFYESVAPHSPIRLPRCYARERDPVTQAHWLLLEDLGSLTAGDQVLGATPAEARSAIEAIGRFHAAWWESPRLESLSWMPRRNIQPARYRAAWPQFLEEFASRLSPSGLALGEILAKDIDSRLAEIERPPHTIVHSDFRADNLLFDSALGRDAAVVLDWQLAIRSRGILDVARFLCGSVASNDRSHCEAALLNRWHELLIEGGVRGYSFDQALADFRQASLICLYYPVTIHAAEEAAGVRGAALAHAQIERFFNAALAWNNNP